MKNKQHYFFFLEWIIVQRAHVCHTLIYAQLRYKCRHRIHVQTGVLHVLQIDILDLLTRTKQLIHLDCIVSRWACGDLLLFFDSQLHDSMDKTYRTIIISFHQIGPNGLEVFNIILQAQRTAYQINKVFQNLEFTFQHFIICVIFLFILWLFFLFRLVVLEELEQHFQIFLNPIMIFFFTIIGL